MPLRGAGAEGALCILVSNFLPNAYQKPNALADKFMHLLSSDEWKVLDYACRRIFGFRKDRDRISLSQFVSGKLNKDGQPLDHGTGLVRATVVKCLRDLVRFGFLIAVEGDEGDDSLGTLYEVETDDANIDRDALEDRAREAAALGQRRTSAARAAALAKRGQSVGQTDAGQSVGQTEASLSDRPEGVCDTDGGRSVGQTHNKQREKQIENKIDKQSLVYAQVAPYAGDRAEEVAELVVLYCEKVEPCRPSKHEIKQCATRVRQKGLDFCKQVVLGTGLDTWKDRWKFNSLSHIFSTDDRMQTLAKIAARRGGAAGKAGAAKKPSAVDAYRQKKGLDDGAG